MIVLSPEHLDLAWCRYVDDVLQPSWADSKTTSYQRVSRKEVPGILFEKWLEQQGGTVIEEDGLLRHIRSLRFDDDQLSTIFVLRWL